MDCPEAKRGKAEVACPPDDSLEEIFLRLHAKPLFRFKCVSKDWCGLITDRLGCRKFPLILEGFLAGDEAESFGRFIGPRPVPLVDPSFSFLTKLPEIEEIVLLDSSNGLVLFGHRKVSDRYDSLGYIVCNPATEEWVSVPSSGYTPFQWYDSDDEDNQSVNEDNQSGDEDKSGDEDNQGNDYAVTYLIFDPAISPHFQLIQFILGYMFELEEVRTFSSVTGVWRTLELEDIPGLASDDLTVESICACEGCPFNGMLHVSAHNQYLPKGKQDMILAVGGEGMPFRTLHWPKSDRGSLVFIGQSQGHLHCLSGPMREDSLTMTELSIWVLEDYNAEKWVLRDNVSLSELFGRMGSCEDAEWNVVAIHPDCSFVFFADHWNCQLISYDFDKKEACALCNLDGYRRHIFPYAPYFAKSAALTKNR